VRTGDGKMDWACKEKKKGREEDWVAQTGPIGREKE